MLPHEKFDGSRMQPNRKHSCGMLKKTSLLSRPTLARRDAPFPNKAAAEESAGGVSFSHPPIPSCQDTSFPKWATLRMLSRRERRWRNFSAFR